MGDVYDKPKDGAPSIRFDSSRRTNGIQVMSTVYLAAILVVFLFYLYMIVATIRNAHNRTHALRSAAKGAAAGAGLAVVLALMIYVALHFGAGDLDGFGRGSLAAFAVFFAAAPALIAGLIGGAIGAKRGSDWRLDEPLAPDNWTPPDTAEVQRVVAGRIIKPDADST
jgi:hypothetical protein